jgi:serine/threonine protein kinase
VRPTESLVRRKEIPLVSFGYKEMDAELAPGTLIAGRYRLERLLGKGGMGQVWAVTHEVTHRSAALKLINGPVHLRADRRRRFLREARAASAVNHPNVVRVHDFFELEDGTPVMIMDLLEGETLGKRLSRDRSITLEDAANVLLPVVSAVGTAHARGIIHRDLKPDNVFLARTEEGVLDVRVLDFGVAKLVSATAHGPDDSDALTGTGGVLGTPSYMSPEQGFGEGSVDHRADIWSLGVVLYESLAGSRPIDGANVGQVLKRLMSEVITPIEVLLPELPAEVAALVGRMLQRDAADRPLDLREVHAVLGRFASVKAPEFAAAVNEAPPPLDSSPRSEQRPAQAVIRVSPDPDPTAATRTAESTLVTVPTFGSAADTGPAPGRSRRRAYLGVSIVLVGAAIAVPLVLAAAARDRASNPASSGHGAAAERAPGATVPGERAVADPPSNGGTPGAVPAATPPAAVAEKAGPSTEEAAEPPPPASSGRTRTRTPARTAPRRPKTPAPAAPASARPGGLVDEPPF